MDQRTGDPRIYIVTLLFLSCILTGGVLLGLYLLQPDPNPLFLQAGMFFVGIPWLFWFLAYIYSCLLKPCIVSLSQRVSRFDPEKGQEEEEEEKNNKSITEIAISDSHPVAAVEPRNSPRDGEKHVQFGNVVVLGNEGGVKAAEEEEDLNERSTNKLIPDHMRMGDEGNQEHGRLNSRSDDDHDESGLDKDCDSTQLRLSVGNK